ncbi:MAG: helix-turn-helix transcriptional regulator, partial [Candidatus Sulfotelmatobacter sp.]
LTYPEFRLSMKQTPDDLRFAGDFAEALRPHIAEAKRNGRSLKQIAEGLGVTEPALKKYLGGRTTPSLRTVVLAYDRYQCPCLTPAFPSRAVFAASANAKHIAAHCNSCSFRSRSRRPAPKIGST